MKAESCERCSRRPEAGLGWARQECRSFSRYLRAYRQHLERYVESKASGDRDLVVIISSLSFDRCRKTRNYKRHGSQGQNYICFTEINNFCYKSYFFTNCLQSDFPHNALKNAFWPFRSLIASVVRVVHHH